MEHVTNLIRSLGLTPRLSVRIHAAFILAILLIPVFSHATVTFVWVPTDGSSSSGVLTIDAPASGYFSLPQTAVTSFAFSFLPGLSVNLNDGRLSDPLIPVVSFDGSSLDYGAVAFQIGRLGGRTIVSSFRAEQVASDSSTYDVSGQNIRVRGNWIRAGIPPVEKPPYPRGVLSVIDIRPVLERRDIGNALGLAFNPDSNVIYLAHGSDQRAGFIYTLDMDGKLLYEFDLQSAYKPGSWPETLSYDRRTGHLFVDTVVPEGAHFVAHLLEIDPHTDKVLSVLTTDSSGGRRIVRSDGLWQPRFQEDVVRHYARDGTFIEDVSVASSFPECCAPLALTSSFMGGGFLIMDARQRIVEVDRAGQEIAAATTVILGDGSGLAGDGRGLAIDSDASTQRIFLAVNNQAIYILSSEFMQFRNANNLVQLEQNEVSTFFDPTPIPDGRLGTFRLVAKFHNVSNLDLCNAFFEVVELAVNHRLKEAWIDSGRQQPIQGPFHAIIGHQPFVFGAGQDLRFEFVIGLSSLDTFFNFFVNLWGAPQAPGNSCP